MPAPQEEAHEKFNALFEVCPVLATLADAIDNSKDLPPNYNVKGIEKEARTPEGLALLTAILSKCEEEHPDVGQTVTQEELDQLQFIFCKLSDEYDKECCEEGEECDDDVLPDSEDTDDEDGEDTYIVGTYIVGMYIVGVYIENTHIENTYIDDIDGPMR